MVYFVYSSPQCLSVDVFDSPDDNRVPLSLAYHLADIYIEELNKVYSGEAFEESTQPPAPLVMLLSPFFALAARTPSTHTFERVQSAVLDPLLQALTPSHTEERSQSKRHRLLENDYSSLLQCSCITDSKLEEKVDKITLRRAVLKTLFDQASDQEARDSNRRKLYAFWKSHVEEEDGDERPIDAS